MESKNTTNFEANTEQKINYPANFGGLSHTGLQIILALLGTWDFDRKPTANRGLLILANWCSISLILSNWQKYIKEMSIKIEKSVRYIVHV